MKLNITREWIEKMAKLEGDAVIGAGVPTERDRLWIIQQIAAIGIEDTNDEGPLADLFAAIHREAASGLMAPSEPQNECNEAAPSNDGLPGVVRREARTLDELSNAASDEVSHTVLCEAIDNVAVRLRQALAREVGMLDLDPSCKASQADLQAVARVLHQNLAGDGFDALKPMSSKSCHQLSELVRLVYYAGLSFEEAVAEVQP